MSSTMWLATLARESVVKDALCRSLPMDLPVSGYWKGCD